MSQSYGPLPDDQPLIVELLSSMADDDAVSPANSAVIRMILKNWYRDESVSTLRTTLGVGGPSRRRRTLRTVSREIELAHALHEALRRGQPQPPAIEIIARRFHCEARTVLRAHGRWKSLIEREAHSSSTRPNPLLAGVIPF